VTPPTQGSVSAFHCLACLLPAMPRFPPIIQRFSILCRPEAPHQGLELTLTCQLGACLDIPHKDAAPSTSVELTHQDLGVIT
jgi:hypothetical protein